MKKALIFLLSSTLVMGCASTDNTKEDTAKVEKKKSCVKAERSTGSSIARRVCKS